MTKPPKKTDGYLSWLPEPLVMLLELLVAFLALGVFVLTLNIIAIVWYGGYLNWEFVVITGMPAAGITGLWFWVRWHWWRNPPPGYDA